MKRTVYLLMSTLILASCGGGQKMDPKAELVKLKKERADLDLKIQKLEAANKDSSKKATAVTIMQVQTTDFVGYIEVQSQVNGYQNVNATPQMPGTVKSVMVHGGEHVSKGQLLASLDVSAIEQQIKAQEVQLNLFRSLYDKQQKLWAQNIGTEVQLMQSKAQYEGAEKQRDALIAQRNMYRIVSPINGMVDAVSIKEGDATAPGAAGIRVVSFDQLKAEASLGENYLGKVKQGDKAILLFPDTNDSIKTTLTYVAQAVDPISRAFLVQIRLNNNSKLHPNMSCKMKIANYENKNALVVPISVIQNTAKGEQIYIVDANNKAKVVSIKTGRNSNGMVEITDGLKAGDKVIVEGYENVDNGGTVAVQ
ncbi:MAG: efflux RND transporter periplasmic adaptor subunit [Bacteroidota bacterium]